MDKKDGSVIIATILDTDGVEKGKIKLEKELDGLGDSAKKANESVGGSLAGGFKKLGAAIVAAGIVDKLVDFGKEAINLGSDLEEVQNVVDVTFETMSDSVNQFAKDAQKSAGLSEKMAKQYVGTFGAMADSFGFTEQEAYEMSTALTQLTGDVASFYNLSQDEAMNKLKGVFTGETEALKELGVVMAQTALDSYAMANGFGKTTSAMSEQEKVALRYQFVMDQLSAASGDFVRTQDSWANQSKVLALQWESLMATIGSGMIDVLSPVLSFINDSVMPALQDLAENFKKAMEPKPADKLRKAIKDTKKAVASANETFKETTEAIDLNAIKAELYRGQLEELEAAGLTTAEAQRQYANAVDALNAIYPELNLKINENTGLLEANSWAQLNNLETMKERALAAAQMEQYNAQLQAWAAAEDAVIQAEASLNQIQKDRDAIQQSLQEQTGLTIEQMIAMYNTNGQVTTALQNENAAVGGLISAIAMLTGETNTLSESQLKDVEQILILNAQEKALTEELNANKDAVAAQNLELQKNAEVYGIATEAAETAADGQKEMSAAAANVTQKIEDLQTELKESTKTARSAIDANIGMFDEFSANTELNAEKIKENWKTQQTGLQNYESNLQTLLARGYMDSFVAQLADGTPEMMALAQKLVDDTSVKVDEFNAEWQRTQEARDSVAEIMGQINADLANKFGEMYATVDGAWGDIEESTRQAVSDMMRAINNLKGKTIYIDTVYRSHGSPSSSGTKTNGIAQPASTSIDIPFLAKGTVIPPNAPFMAVLGDQRRGTNIEAPLSTIQEAVAVVMGDMVSSNMAGHQATVDALHQILEAVYGIEIGDSVIGKAAERYNQKMAIMRGR